HARIPGHAVHAAFEGARFGQALDQPLGQAVGLDVVGEVVDAAGVGELGHPGGADLGDVGAGPSGHGGDEVVVGAVPGLDLDVEGGTGLLGEGLAQRGDVLAGVGVGALHQPHGDGLAFSVDLPAAVIASAGGQGQGGRTCRSRGEDLASSDHDDSFV